MKEQDLVNQCLQWLHLAGVFAWRCNSGAVAGEYKGKRRFVKFQSINGVSDILGVIPPNGQLLAVECKSDRGKLRSSQEAFLSAVQAAGGLVIVVRSLDTLVVVLKEYGVEV